MDTTISTPIPNKAPTKRLILFPQDKGGIGKSFVATLLYDHLTEHKVKLKTFDLDHANSTFARYVQEAEFIDTDVDTDKLGDLDKLIRSLETVDTVLVDNRAAGGTKILKYIEDSRLAELQGELHFELVFVIIAIDDKDAISQAADVAELYGNKVKWMVARNYRDTYRLAMYDPSKTREKLESLGAIEIEVPCLSEVTRNKLQIHNLTVAGGGTSEKLYILDRSRCLQFHNRMREEFAKVKHLLLT